MASIAMGGSCWDGTVKMLLGKGETAIKEILDISKSYVRRVFNQ